jgi:RimJ/RimL family protein N-acetyltransferase
MAAFEPILTERLAIRGLDMADAEDFSGYRSLPEVYEFQSFRPKDEGQVTEFLCGLAELPDIRNSWFQLAVCLKGDGVLIGDIGIHFLEDDAQAEIGYTISPDYQGQGYGTEAVSAVISYLFTGLRKHRIIASVDPRNTRSVKLLDRLGMRREAHFVKSIVIDGKWCDDCVYALLREEWEGLS